MGAMGGCLVVALTPIPTPTVSAALSPKPTPSAAGQAITPNVQLAPVPGPISPASAYS